MPETYKDTPYGDSNPLNTNPIEANAGHKEDPAQYSRSEGELYSPETKEKVADILDSAAHVLEKVMDSEEGYKTTVMGTAAIMGVSVFVALYETPGLDEGALLKVVGDFIRQSSESGTLPIQQLVNLPFDAEGREMLIKMLTVAVNTGTSEDLSSTALAAKAALGSAVLTLGGVAALGPKIANNAARALHDQAEKLRSAVEDPALAQELGL